MFHIVVPSHSPDVKYAYNNAKFSFKVKSQRERIAKVHESKKKINISTHRHLDNSTIKSNFEAKSFEMKFHGMEH